MVGCFKILKQNNFQKSRKILTNINWGRRTKQFQKNMKLILPPTRPSSSPQLASNLTPIFEWQKELVSKNPFANRVKRTLQKIRKNLIWAYPAPDDTSILQGPNNKNFEIPKDADRIEDENVMANIVWFSPVINFGL